VTKRIVGAKPVGAALESTVGGAGRRGAVAQLTSTNMQTSTKIFLRITLLSKDTRRDRKTGAFFCRVPRVMVEYAPAEMIQVKFPLSCYAYASVRGCARCPAQAAWSNQTQYVKV
jgi:hypothetical protein